MDCLGEAFPTVSLPVKPQIELQLKNIGQKFCIYRPPDAEEGTAG